ncbi:hypothetical protein [Nocardia australiensis]|uniref:hypothetical protein n=1 Tax=Nocardia australiensis TaxID=2887191 RepID=UPI001D143BAF|nr:hypothetical protein [Nocardia australiensis]
MEGAKEVSDAQVGLAYAERGSTELAILDLAGETTNTVALSIRADNLLEDGRFVYVSDRDRTIEVIDTGVWTVNHVDHVHYYRAPTESVGTVSSDAPMKSVIGDAGYTAIGTADGKITILDRRGLEAGHITVVAELSSDAAVPFAVPYQDGFLVSSARGVSLVDLHGNPSGALDAECREPAGWAILRSGVAIGCEEGILLVKHKPDGEQSLMIPYPKQDVERVREFHYRPRSNEAAAVAGAGVWNVNASEQTLNYVPVENAVTAPVVAANSPANGDFVLSLGGDGHIRTTALTDSTTIADAPLLPAGTPGPIRLDTSRAYLADRAASVIYELDYADRLRTARTFTVDAKPDLLVEVGR